MSNCPSCGRYVGPYEACPYCGARIAGRTPIRVVKIVAVVLATVGLVALWLAATRTEVPLVTIGQVGATMNLAYVRLEGHVSRVPTYYTDTHYLSFWIADDTGEMRVSSYRAQTEQLIEEGRVPALGDLVTVAGTLRVREDFLGLTLNVPEQLHIVRADPLEMEIGGITPEYEFLRVKVRGQVREVYEPYEGLKLITVRDETGSISVAVYDVTEFLTGELPELSPGDAVEVTGAVSLYQDTPQLVPASVADVAPAAQEVTLATEVRIGQLTSGDVGRLVAVRGMVTQVNPFSAGVKFVLDDGTGQIVLLLWQSVYEALPDSAALGVGAEVWAQGEVSAYRGELEILPELAEDVWMLSAAAAEEVAVGSLTAEDVGRVVTLRGTLGEPERFSAGVKFPLHDGTGQIVLLLWSDVYERAPEGLGAGAQVVVTGEVSEYRGELELIPRNASEIEVTGAAAAPTPEAEVTPIGNITSDDVGQSYVVEGVIGEPEPFSAGVKFDLDDGTGTIILLLWQNVYDAYPDADRLVAGARVLVSGEIEEYRGELEIIPEADGVKVVE